MLVSRGVLVTFLASLPLAAHGATSAAFSYDPNAINGPENWGNLPIEGNACDGKSNSPIAVETRACDRFEDYRFVAGTCGTDILEYALTNTGVKAAYPGFLTCENPRVEIPGISGQYQALQFHIHTSSEHTIDGEFFGAELHTVHQEVGGDRFAVVGMMIQPSADLPNELFQELLDGWQEVMEFNVEHCAESLAGDRKLQRKLAGPFNPYQLIPEGSTFYHYDGGLTTPPCSEVVWWNLADKPVAISPSQYNQLVSQVLDYTDIATCELGTNAGPAGSTSRPPQPLNGRYVERICPVGFEEEEEIEIEADESSASSMSVIGAAAVAGAALLL